MRSDFSLNSEDLIDAIRFFFKQLTESNRTEPNRFLREKPTLPPSPQFWSRSLSLFFFENIRAVAVSLGSQFNSLTFGNILFYFPPSRCGGRTPAKAAIDTVSPYTVSRINRIVGREKERFVAGRNNLENTSRIVELLFNKKNLDASKPYYHPIRGGGGVDMTGNSRFLFFMAILM